MIELQRPLLEACSCASTLTCVIDETPLHDGDPGPNPNAFAVEKYPSTTTTVLIILYISVDAAIQPYILATGERAYRCKLSL